ncbi:MAG: chemotaxis protein CheB [Bacteroidota bacterium]
MSSRKQKSSTRAATVPEASSGDSAIECQSEPIDFQIVGIGASAGGLEALELFFTNMPRATGLAFVVIQHLDPDYVGIMPELLQRCTEMKVLQATDRLRVERDHVYVIPPNRSMSLLNGALHLFEPVESRGLRLPIDVFFRSLADEKRERSIGVILSGMGSDGSHGLKAIKEKNGVTVVQLPESAKFDGMPRSAIDSVVCDIVDDAEKLPARILAFLEYAPSASMIPGIGVEFQSNLEKIIILIREQTGHDFSLYKKSTLFRRIERRKGIHQIEKIQHYVRFLQENPGEVQILFKELLIGVTSFFRDTAVWDALKEKVLPELIANLPDGYVLRAWVPACSTGEEAYSLAMLFKEVIQHSGRHNSLTLQIFATDIDVDAIERARRGYFVKGVATEVPSERLNKFFSHDSDGYRINFAIREMVVFAPQNVIRDPPFTKLDILLCRNMLIYMEPVLQKQIISLFHYSLNLNGVLVLGSAETLGSKQNGFIALGGPLKIFKRIATDLPPDQYHFPSSFHQYKTPMREVNPTNKPVENIQVLTDQILLQRFSPASVLVNADGDIVYITGKTGKYLEPVAGRANWNIYAMARDGLRPLLPKALRDAAQNSNPVVLHDVVVNGEARAMPVDVTIQRIDEPKALQGYIIIVFSDAPARIETAAGAQTPGRRGRPDREKELEEEIQHLREDFQAIREEMQTSQEELKSTNEELQSTNEELQSTNEELTTSKEEMQSLNEELHTVNMELQTKVSEFMLAEADMKNLLNSTEIATLFLDRDLNIRRYTDQITSVFKLRSTDVGRPFTDMVHDLNYPEMARHASEVLRKLVPMETEVETRDDRWFRVRIMPYRTIEDRIDGLVMTFTDITATKTLELKLIAANTSLRDSSSES